LRFGHDYILIQLHNLKALKFTRKKKLVQIQNKKNFTKIEMRFIFILTFVFGCLLINLIASPLNNSKRRIERNLDNKHADNSRNGNKLNKQIGDKKVHPHSKSSQSSAHNKHDKANKNTIQTTTKCLT
jgi:hypothetical protein